MKKHYDRPKHFCGLERHWSWLPYLNSFRIWPPSTTLWRDFQKDAEQFAFPHNRLKLGDSDAPRVKIFLKAPMAMLRAQLATMLATATSNAATAIGGASEPAGLENITVYRVSPLTCARTPARAHSRYRAQHLPVRNFMCTSTVSTPSLCMRLVH